MIRFSFNEITFLRIPLGRVTSFARVLIPVQNGGKKKIFLSLINA